MCCKPNVSFEYFDVHNPSFAFLTGVPFGSRCIGLWLVDAPRSFQCLQSLQTSQLVCLLCGTLMDVVCFISIDVVGDLCGSLTELPAITGMGLQL